MTSADFRQYTGDEWEDLVHTLLHLRYRTGDYQRVPSEHRGDCGIESYSTDGNVYQCYAAQAWTTLADLYERQRDKMSTDVRKFTRNSARLAPILGELRVRRWLLIVPEHKSAQLLAHASSKSEEVLAAAVPYVHPDFRVGVLDIDDFRLEYAKLVNGGDSNVSIEDVVIDRAALERFTAASSSSSLLNNLTEKLSRVPQLSNIDRKETLVKYLTHEYLRGQAYLDQLHANYPDLYRRVAAFKRRKENQLVLQSLVTSSANDGRLEAQMKEFEIQLASEVPKVTPMMDALVGEAIADWLMRCPLDFFPLPPASSTAA
jgi:hypothetical protein